MKTKIPALFLTAALLFSLAACGRAETETTAAAATTVQTTLPETTAAAETTTQAVTTQSQTDARTTAETTTQATTAALSAEDLARKALLPAAASFAGSLETSLNGVKYPYYKGLGTSGKTAGYIFTTSADGYKRKIKTMVGIDAKGAVTGVEIVEIYDTEGLGTKVKEVVFLNQFKGKTEKITITSSSARKNEVQAVTAVTISSSAVVKAVNLALELYKTVA